MRTRPILGTLLLAAALSTAASCRQPVPPESTQEYRVVAIATDVVIALGTLQHAAIELNEKLVCDSAAPPVCAPLLSEANTRIVVQNVTSTLTAMGPNPANIQVTVDTTLKEIESRLDAAGKTKILPYIQAVRVVAGLLPLIRSAS